jgi:hypothetical protein
MIDGFVRHCAGCSRVYYFDGAHERDRLPGSPTTFTCNRCLALPTRPVLDAPPAAPPWRGGVHLGLEMVGRWPASPVADGAISPWDAPCPTCRSEAGALCREGQWVKRAVCEDRLSYLPRDTA